MVKNTQIGHQKYSAKIKQATRFKKILKLFEKQTVWSQKQQREELGIGKSRDPEAKLLERDLSDMVDLKLLKKIRQKCPLCGTIIARSRYVKRETWEEVKAVNMTLKKVFSRMES